LDINVWEIHINMRPHRSINNKTPSRWENLDIPVSLLLIVLILCVYYQTGTHEFVNYDDEVYVTSNHHVVKGLGVTEFIWAFTTSWASNWHPLTWLSHMMDIQMYGINPGAHHFTNVLFHIMNSLLFFFLFRKMTGDFWQCCFLAILFAIHPLHVESVAWVAERKDVLSTFLGLLTLWSYIRYVENPLSYRYGLTLFFFSLGLMAKPMLVTFPFVLLLLDYWPLRRFDFNDSFQEDRRGKIYDTGAQVFRLIIEKLPLMVIAAGSSFITLMVQQKGGAVGTVTVFPLWDRVANALITYIGYIEKMFWPFDLAVIYPYPAFFPIIEIVSACLLFAAVTAFGLMVGKRLPYVIVGWLWYIGTLVPVIGLVQIGSQSMADRYTYVPLIGICIIISWGAGDLTARWANGKRTMALCALIVTLCMTISAHVQTRYWKSSVPLYQHALAVTSGNWIANNNLGCALSKQGRTSQAIQYFQEALRINPDYTDAHYNLALAFVSQNRFNDAINHFARVVATRPDDKDVHIRLGRIFILKKQFKKAVDHFTRASELDPNDAEVYNNLGVSYANQGDFRKAVFFLKKAVAIKPDFLAGEKNLQKARESLNEHVLPN
jgi:Flp pilus assembly protein TadD